MLKMMTITALVYAAGVSGFLSGTIFALCTSKVSRLFHGTLLNISAGLLLAYVCFSMLPTAFNAGGVKLGVVGIVAGATVCALLSNKMEQAEGLPGSLKIGLLVLAALSLHKLPEGMALGSLLYVDMAAGLSMALVVALHCIPEALVLSLNLREGGMGAGHLLAACFLVCLPMALGSFLGIGLSQVYGPFGALCLSFSGGVMIYIACGEIVPEHGKRQEQRVWTMGALVGFGLGVLLTAGQIAT